MTSPIFSLTSLDLDNANWEISSHRGPAIVRVGNEREAREVAARAFDVKTGLQAREKCAHSALDATNAGEVERFNDPRFNGEGPAAGPRTVVLITLSTIGLPCSREDPDLRCRSPSSPYSWRAQPPGLMMPYRTGR